MDKTTHNSQCKMAFGRPTKEVGICPRCDELRAGAAPRAGWSDAKQEFERRSLLYIKSHNCQTSGCGSTCTFGDW